jgi:hypothetical protein
MQTGSIIKKSSNFLLCPKMISMKFSSYVPIEVHMSGIYSLNFNDLLYTQAQSNTPTFDEWVELCGMRVGVLFHLAPIQVFF